MILVVQLIFAYRTSGIDVSKFIGSFVKQWWFSVIFGCFLNELCI